MYDNILHKPLVMRAGASTTAWALLQGLLEKDGTCRLGSMNDFVCVPRGGFSYWSDSERHRSRWFTSAGGP